MIKHLKVRVKLLGSFSIVIILFSAIVAYMIYFLSVIEELNERQHGRNQDVRFALELKNEIGVIYSIQSDVMINENGEAASQFMNRSEDFKKKMVQAAEMLNDANKADELIAAIHGYIDNFGRWLNLHNFRSYMEPDELLREFQAADAESDRYKEIIYSGLDSLIEQKDAEFRHAQEELKSKISKVSVVFVIVAAMAVLMTIGVTALIGSNLANPLIRLTVSARKVAAGDLTGQMVSDGARDEIGKLTQSFAEMTNNLKSLIQQVNHAAEEVAASSEQLTASAEESARRSQSVVTLIEQVAAGAQAQAKASAESSAAMDEMASGVQQIAESASHVLAASQLAAEKAKDGNAAIHEVVGQMSSIRSSVDEQVNVVFRLDGKSNEISEMVSAITSIAKKTNLLALNAAIEASRAGEHGKGFAVVAAEIRNLAEQSRESAEKITELVGSIQQDVKEIVSVIRAGSDEVEKGMMKAEKTGELFEAIVRAVEEVAKQIQEMSALSQQMSAGSEEVAASVSEIADIARETSRFAQNMSADSEEQMAIIQQISASAAHLSSRAAELQELISKFKVN